MKQSYSKTKAFALLTTMALLLGCETGTKNKAPENGSYSMSSGIVSQKTNYKSHVPKETEIKKIYTNSGTPGYYVQVGYFGTQKPNDDIINRLEYASLPYAIVKKGSRNYLLVGAYSSYNKAREIQGIAQERVAEGAFIVKVVRP